MMWQLFGLLTIFAVTISAAIFVGVMIASAIPTGNWQKPAIGIAVGISSMALFLETPMLGVFRVFICPMIIAALTIALTTTKSEWNNLNTRPVDDPKLRLKPAQAAVVLMFIAMGAALAIHFQIGKPLLRELGQNVIGNTPSERKEIMFYGGGAVGLLGCAVGILVVAAFSSSPSESSDSSPDD